jgi:enhancing lycopene biosynthesis protein 2
MATSFVTKLSKRSITVDFVEVLARQFSVHVLKQAKIAVVLSGCGVYDGSEIHEASATLVHLSKEKADVKMFAPDKQQMHVVNHTTGQEMNESRNVMVEAARIARGDIEALDKLTAEGYDGVIFPGGFGAAKNLSSFATAQSSAYDVDKEVERVIKEFKAQNKPMGFLCISPVLPVKVLEGVEVTVGGEEEEGGKWPYAGTAGVIAQLGKHVKGESVTDVHVDERNKIVSVPAFMGNAPLGDIFDGIGLLVKAVLKLASK